MDQKVQHGCERKTQHLEQSLANAKAVGDLDRIDGLEISLAKVQAYCTDEDLIKEVEDKISDQKEDLKEHTQDLEQALADGRVDKIEKYKAKIEKDHKRIEELSKELEALS